MPRVVALVAVLAVAGACTDFSDTPDPLIGGWTAVDAEGVLDVTTTVTYHPDHRLEVAYDGDLRGGTWRRIDELTVEHCTTSCYEVVHRGDLAGDVILHGDAVLYGPAAPGLAGTSWGGGYSSCCANGSEYFTSIRLELNADGSAVYSQQPQAMGPVGMMWTGTWTEGALGAVVANPSSGTTASYVRVGDMIGTLAYRRTTELR